MKYRINQRTGDKISEIGLGSAYLFEAGMNEGVKALHTAFENGINYYDLACSGDILAEQHYRTLEMKASDCISCGHCDKRCPFRVKQSERMRRINDYFGE